MVAANNISAAPAERVLVLTRVFDAPRELVFAAWTKPEHLVRWWGPKDFTLPFCEQDFRVGGAYRFCMRSPEGIDYWVWGNYREIVEPQRLVFTWFRDDEKGNITNESVVTLAFARQGSKTKLTLHQAVFKTTEDRDAHQGGWTQCLERLGAYMEQARNRNQGEPNAVD